MEAKCETMDVAKPEDVKEDPEAEKEKALILEQLEEMKKRAQWRRDLRERNVDIENRPDDDDLRKFDSSLKKNTAFVRKLKTYTESQKPSIEKDMGALNLTKYIGEVAAAIVEAKLKMSDIPSVVEICSLLHQKYGEFAPNFLENWKKCLGGQQKTPSNPSKLRVDIRFYCDCISVGIFTPKEGLPLLGGLLTSLTANEDPANIGIIMSFCRFSGDDFAGLVPRKVRVYAAESGLESPSAGCEFLAAEKQKNVAKLLRDYFNNIINKLAKDFKELKHIEKTNYSILMTKGELHVERKKNQEDLSASIKKLKTNAEQLADLLDEDVPPLKIEEEAKEGLDALGGEASEVGADGVVSDANALGPLWEDDETKSFYEILVDLPEIVPAILYKDSKGQAPQASTEASSKESPEKEDVEDIENEPNEPPEDMDDDNIAPPNIEDEPEDSENQNLSNKAILDAYLANLPNCVNREMIDQAAIDFCMKLNTKSNRKKLVKSLFSVHRNRQDLLPFYGRLVATLDPCMPDVAIQLAQYLKQEFRWQVRKKDQMKIESKLKVCRFIGEMVKFNMFQKSEALFCLKQLLFDFSHHHIEMACTLVDTCGRFLHRTPDSHQRTKIYLEQMMRKKTAMMTMDPRYTMMIENAFYVANPPTLPAGSKSQAEQLTPMQKYIEKLVFTDLTGTSTEKVLKQIRKMHWNDPEETAFVVKTLGSVWKYKYYNIRYGASLIAGLISYHEWVGPQIVDDTLESMKVGLEIGDPRYNQRRLAVARFIGELYNYRLIDSAVVFKVLYSLITFGVDEEYSNDSPDDTFRLRLISVILDTCGVYFNSGSSKTKLKYYLAYFQRYYWKKRSHPCWSDQYPFPWEVANGFEDTLKLLRPKTKPHKSLEDAEAEVRKIEDEVLKTIKGKAPEVAAMISNANAGGQPEGREAGLGAISEEAENETSDHEPRSYSEAEDTDLDNDATEDDEEEEEDYSKKSLERDELTDDDQDMDELETTILEGTEDLHIKSQRPKHIKCEEDDDFINMFDKMMNDNLNESKVSVPKSQQLDLVAPVSFRQTKKTYADLRDEEVETPKESTTVQFAVLMRKGAKPSLKEVAVPKDTDIAMNLERQEEAQRLEKENLKKLTLEINERQEEEEVNAAIAAMQRPGLVAFRDDRRQKAMPHKGVPANVDAIFGNKRGGQNK